ncbi:MAG: hypothetical protein IJH60_03640 [Eubacterium sp.]|nr:hypothetical protein [Eubacterium sp.]
MKKMIIGLGLFLLALGMTWGFFSVKSHAAAGSLDMGNVIQMGDFEGSSHYIVFYPKEMESGNRTYPVAVWANGTMCAPVLYTNLLKGVAARGYVVVASSDMMSADGKSQSAAIDYICKQNTEEDSILCGKLTQAKSQLLVIPRVEEAL